MFFTLETIFSKENLIQNLNIWDLIAEPSVSGDTKWRKLGKMVFSSLTCHHPKAPGGALGLQRALLESLCLKPCKKITVIIMLKIKYTNVQRWTRNILVPEFFYRILQNSLPLHCFYFLWSPGFHKEWEFNFFFPFFAFELLCWCPSFNNKTPRDRTAQGNILSAS